MRLARLWGGALAVALGAGVVALAAFGGSLYWNGVQLNGERTTRAELAPLAAEQIPRVFGYDYQTVERNLNDVYPLLTPAYRQEFRDRADQDIIRRRANVSSSARPTSSAWASRCTA